MSDGAGNGQAVSGLMSEENLARRIAWEMERRGWSQERVAKEMTDAGHPLHQSSVSKIVNPKDGKRRSISVEDAIGFAKVFGVAFDNLLLPLEAVWDTDLRDALLRVQEIQQQRDALDREAASLITQVVQVAQAAGEDFFDRHLTTADSATRERLLDEMYRWAQRLNAQAESSALSDLTDEEKLERLRQIMFGGRASKGGRV